MFNYNLASYVARPAYAQPYLELDPQSGRPLIHAIPLASARAGKSAIDDATLTLWTRSAALTIEQSEQDLLGRTYFPSIPKGSAEIMDHWVARNAIRCRLIDAKYDRGLNKAEKAELRQLTREISEHADALAPRSFDVLDKLESYVRRVEAKANKKRGKRS